MLGKVGHEANVDVAVYIHMGRRTLGDSLAGGTPVPADFAGPSPVAVGGENDLFPFENSAVGVSWRGDRKPRRCYAQDQGDLMPISMSMSIVSM